MKPNKSFSFPVASLIAFIIIGLWGCLMIYASRAVISSSHLFVWRQLLWLVLGCAGFSLASVLPFRKLMQWRIRLLLAALTALVLVLIFGTTIRGMAGWFAFTDNILFQPSEFVKPVFILILASLGGDEQLTEQRKFVYQLLVSFSICFLILLEPDFGSATVFYFGMLTVFWLQNMKKRYLLPVILAALAGAVCFLAVKPYAYDRILSFLHPGSTLYRGTWHIRQFQYALAEGGWTGSEHGTALWSNAYLPLAHSDSLYAMIVETSGFCGGVIVLIAFSAAVFGMVRLAYREPVIPQARLYICGISFLYLAQALLHIGVNVVLLPPTGITLPLLSYGGSSLCSTMIAFGIAFSALRETK